MSKLFDNFRHGVNGFRVRTSRGTESSGFMSDEMDESNVEDESVLCVSCGIELTLDDVKEYVNTCSTCECLAAIADDLNSASRGG